MRVALIKDAVSAGRGRRRRKRKRRKRRRRGKAYQLKALELTNSTIPLIYQSAHCGCAGIGRQLHPMKAKDLLKDKLIEIKRENDMWVLIYQSIAIKIATLAIPCQCIKGVLESVVNCIP